MKTKKITLSIVLTCLSLFTSACMSNKQPATPSHSSHSSSQLSSTTASSHSLSSETSSSTTLNEEAKTDELAPFIGDWALKIAGQEGYQLIIDTDRFQFFTLYNGHIAPPNEDNVSYRLATTGQELTLTGDREAADILRGLPLENGQANDTLVVTLTTVKHHPALSVVANGESVQLSSGENLFSQLTSTPTILPWPPN